MTEPLLTYEEAWAILRPFGPAFRGLHFVGVHWRPDSGIPYWEATFDLFPTGCATVRFRTAATLRDRLRHLVALEAEATLGG